MSSAARGLLRRRFVSILRSCLRLNPPRWLARRWKQSRAGRLRRSAAARRPDEALLGRPVFEPVEERVLLNADPIAMAETYTVAEDSVLTVSEDLGVLQNDDDEDGDGLTITSFDDDSDSDGDNAQPINQEVDLDKHGALLTLGDDGAFIYDTNGQFDLDPGQTETDTFTYTVSDGQGGTATAQVTIVIEARNDAPTAVDDTAVTDEDTALSVPADGVLDNDTDPESDPLTVAAVNGSTGDVGSPITLSSGAQLQLDSNGGYAYDPNGAFENLADGQAATDTFSYTVSDGEGGFDSAQVVVTVNGLNDAPTANADMNTTDEKTVISVNVPGVIGNDTDPDDGDTLTVDQVAGDAGNVGQAVAGDAGGLFTIHANGSYAFDPDGAFDLAAGESEMTAVTYRVSDGNGETSTSTLTVEVTGANDPPTAVDDEASADEDGPAVSINLTGNDTDPDASDDLEIDSIDLTGTAGSVTINADDDSVTYDPTGAFEQLATGETETDTFTYTVSDGNGGQDTGTVTVTLTGQNDAPVVDATDAALGYTENDGAVAVDTGLTVSDVDDTDLDGATVTISSGFVSGEDVLGFTDQNGITGSFDTGTGVLTLSGTASVADYQAALRSVTYENTSEDPDDATRTVTFEVDDGSATGSDTRDINVTAVNDAPVAEDDDETTDKLTPTTVDVLANDSDVDNDSADLSVSGFDDSGTQGQVTDNGDGTFGYDPDGQFDGLAAGETATDTFTYTVSDGNGGTDTATVTITVTGVNEAPVAADDTFSTDEDTVLSVSADGVLDNDSDPETDPLEVTAVNGEADDVDTQITLASDALLTLNEDGSFDYDPNGQFEDLAAGETATDTFTYTVSDGNGGTDTATVTITVNGVNDAPVADDDAFSTDEDTAITTGNVLVNDTDVDNGAVLTVSDFDASGTQGLVTDNGDGTFGYDPAGAFEDLAPTESATDTFTYTVSDGNGGTDTATVTITVNGVNDAPVADDDAFSTDEDTAITTGDVLANDSDVDNDSADLIVSGFETSGTQGQVTDNGDGTFGYDPAGAFEDLAPTETATDTFTYTVSDGNGGTDTATVTITVNGVNDAPVAVDDAFETGENAVLNVTAPGVLQNDSDPEMDPLDVTEVNGTAADVDAQITLPSGALLTLNVDGSFEYDPNDVFDGLAGGEEDTDSFTYTVSDGNGGTDTATVTITVNGEDDFQIVESDTFDRTEVAGTDFSFPAFYDVTTGDNTLTGIGVRMHFDSSVLDLALDENGDPDLENIFDQSLLATDPELKADVNDDDNDPATDTFLSIAWVDFDGEFPNQALPQKLFDANFTVDPSVAGGSETSINFTASSTAGAFGFQSQPTTLTIQEPVFNLDVDLDGEVKALTDGLLVMRSMFGFMGDSLTSGAVDPDATRTDAEAITDFVDRATLAELDVDDNGEVNALTDGLLIVRHLMGVGGSALVDGALGAGANRTDPTDIANHIEGLKPGGGSPVFASEPPASGDPVFQSTLASSAVDTAAEPQFESSVGSGSGHGDLFTLGEDEADELEVAWRQFLRS